MLAGNWHTAGTGYLILLRFGYPSINSCAAAVGVDEGDEKTSHVQDKFVVTQVTQ